MALVLTTPTAFRPPHAARRNAPKSHAKTRRTRRSPGVVARRVVGIAAVQGEWLRPQASCPANANANGVAPPSPATVLAEERGQPWVCPHRGNQPHRGCGPHRVSKEKAISRQARRVRQGAVMRFARRAPCLGVRKVCIPKILTPRREDGQESWSCFTPRRRDRRGEPLFIRRVSCGLRSPPPSTISPQSINSSRVVPPPSGSR